MFFFPCFWDPVNWLVSLSSHSNSHHLHPIIYSPFTSSMCPEKPRILLIHESPWYHMISYDVPFFDLTQNHFCGWNPIVLVLKCQPIHRLHNGLRMARCGVVRSEVQWTQLNDAVQVIQKKVAVPRWGSHSNRYYGDIIEWCFIVA